MSFSRKLRNWVPLSKGAGDQILRFLGVWTKRQVHRWNRELPMYHHADLCRAVGEFFPKLGLTVQPRGVGGLQFPLYSIRLDALINTRFHTGFAALGRTWLATGPGRKEALVSDAAFFVSGGPFPLVFFIQHQGLIHTSLMFQGAVPAVDGAAEWAEEVTGRLDEWVCKNSGLRGQLLRPAIRLGEPCQIEYLEAPEDEIYEPGSSMLERLEESFIDFLIHKEKLSQAGIEGPRGLLLCGPPGTGKTSTCRWLKRRLPGHTMLTVGSDSLVGLKDCFDVARRLSPTILVIEDVDTLPQLRDPAVGNQVLAELMNQMDGLAVRDDVSVILTSNSWEFLEKAIIERPGRVDQILLFEPPRPEHRHVLLERLTQKLSRSTPLERLVQLTEGLTPAQIKEFVKRAAVSSLRRGKGGSWDHTLTASDFERAIDGMRSGPAGRAHRLIGLKPVKENAANRAHALATRAAGGG